MRKSIILGLGIIAIVASLTSCKKGENDPFLSLITRKARLSGEWKLSNETTEYVYVGYEYIDGNYVESNNTLNETYDGKVKTGTEIIVAAGQTKTETIDPEYFDQFLTIEKDGTFKYENIQYDEVGTKMGTVVYEGNWAFVGKNKSLDLKNKEAISLNFTKYTETNSDGEVSTGTTTSLDSWILKIDQLKKKEIIFKSESVFTNENGKVSTYKTVSTYTAK